MQEIKDAVPTVSEGESAEMPRNDFWHRAAAFFQTPASRIAGLVFALGFFLGVVVKSEAGPRLTIGFQDYAVNPARLDMNAMEEKAAQEGNTGVAPMGAPGGGSCGL